MQRPVQRPNVLALFLQSLAGLGTGVLGATLVGLAWGVTFRIAIPDASEAWIWAAGFVGFALGAPLGIQRMARTQGFRGSMQLSLAFGLAPALTAVASGLLVPGEAGEVLSMLLPLLVPPLAVWGFNALNVRPPSA